MTFHIITLFPEAFESYVNASIIGRAVNDKKIKIKFYNPRDFTKDKWKRVDHKPYAGGPGMVLEAPSLIKAVESALKKAKKPKVIWLAPGGKQFDNAYAAKAAEKYTDLVILCGRYEGMDARVRKIFKAEEITVGPYVLTGGELPAMIMLDTISRQIPGVLGKIGSLEESRTASSDVYTRPEILEYKGKKYRVPKVLLSGNHKLIEEWRKNKNGKM
jgi:tRNA (guanine37-N1)-methyltransferase